MTKNKWLDVVELENVETQNKYPSDLSPETWHVAKKAILDFVQAVDEATEVYNMENKGK